MATQAYIDATDATFVADVIEFSHERPVVVDFWAPWCGPCRVLGPVIERIAAEHGDQVRLVKVNVDENPGVAGQLGIRSIPHVIAFRGGQPADQFLGAVPEQQVRSFFERLLPGPADDAVRDANWALANGHLETARERFEAALALDARHEAATQGLAALLLETGEYAHAIRYAERLPGLPEARRVAALARFRLEAGDADRAALEARIGSNGSDAASHFALGTLLAAQGEWEPALEHLLETVRLDRSLADDGGRRRMLEVFDVLGESDPLVRTYRQRLANVLF